MGKRFAILILTLLLTAGLAGASEVVIRVGPPPPVQVGMVGVAPGPGYVWTDGYHAWRGNHYAWVPGRWVRPPHHHAAWVPAHYRAIPGGWTFVPGHWRY
jgi:hypothetical protein